MQNPTKFRVGFNSKMNRMKKEHNVACLWVDNLEYQSNTVIIAELVLRGRPQPVNNLACNKH